MCWRYWVIGKFKKFKGDSRLYGSTICIFLDNERFQEDEG